MRRRLDYPHEDSCRGARISESNTIARAGERFATVESLTADLASLGVAPGSVVLVHSSLSALGWVCGGPVAVIEALLKAVGDNGTLVMPAHSADVSDPSSWDNPPVPSDWWPLIRESMPTFDPRVTPTLAIGVIAENFRSWPGVLRSNHPTSSLAARGPRASEILTEQPLDDPHGELSPLARLYGLGGQVLLLGASFGSNTSLHLAERRAFGDRQSRCQSGSPVLVEGLREWVQYEEPDVDETDFERLGSAFLEESSSVKKAKVGACKAMLMPQVDLIDFGVQWLIKNRDELGRPLGE
jgi:aminoglycoside 3-N-acetyltransferase